MLSQRFAELSSDPENPASIAELVVTALGPQGSFYLCYKSKAGKYEQESHGIPEELHKWLFNPDNGKRHFDTLQVILGPGDDEFLASDQNDKIEHKRPEAKKPALERAATVMWAARRFTSRRSTSDTQDDDSAAPTAAERIDRRRSATMPTGGRDPSRPYSLMLANAATAATAATTASDPMPEIKHRRMSSAIQPILRPSRRSESPSSSSIAEESQSSSQPASRVPSYRSFASTSSRASGSIGAVSEITTSSVLTDMDAHLQVALKPTSSYVDAAVQTSPKAVSRHAYVDEGMQHDGEDCHDLPDTPITQSLTNFEVEARQVSMPDEPVSSGASYTLDAGGWEGANNPVRMGRMLDYFRSPGYRLGDALYL